MIFTGSRSDLFRPPLRLFVLAVFLGVWRRLLVPRSACILWLFARHLLPHRVLFLALVLRASLFSLLPVLLIVLPR